MVGRPCTPDPTTRTVRRTGLNVMPAFPAEHHAGSRDLRARPGPAKLPACDPAWPSPLCTRSPTDQIGEGEQPADSERAPPHRRPPRRGRPARRRSTRSAGRTTPRSRRADRPGPHPCYGEGNRAFSTVLAPGQPGESADQASELVVRGGVEPPTFRFSGGFPWGLEKSARGRMRYLPAT